MLDYLIIGLGLGGMHFAHCLTEENKKFAVLDDRSQKASQVAGGLCNPVAFNKFSIVWNGKRNLSIAIQSYRSLEQKVGIKALFPMRVHLKFNSKEEQGKWLSATEKQEMKAFLNPHLISFHAQIQSKHQFGEVMQSYLVQLPELLNSFKNYLEEKQCFFPVHFDHRILKIEKDHVIYKNFRARRIVFCEGFGLKENRFFNYLPLTGNKGEYIIVRAPELKLKEILKASYFLIPLGKDLYKFGATYERDFGHSEPDVEAKTKLTTALDNLIDCPYSLIDQIAGIRPTTPDRNALVGRHPTFPNLYTCNGFGSRGILNAPALVQELWAFIHHKRPLSPEIDIARFQKKCFEKN